MKINAKLTVAFLAITVLVALIGLFGLKSIDNVSERFDIIADETAPALKALGTIKASVLRIHAEALAFALGGDQRVGDLKELEESKEKLEQLEADYAKVVDTEEEKKWAQDIEKGETTFYQANLKLVALAKQGADKAAFGQQLENLEVIENDFVNLINKVIDKEMADLKAQDSLADQTVLQAHRFTIIASIVALLLALATGFLMSKLIAKPLAVLTNVTQKIKEGDLSQRADIKSKDEIGELAASFNAMTDSIQDKNEELKTFNEELQTSNEELKSTNEELEAANEEIRETQEKLLQQEKLAAVGQLASGVGHELRNPLGVLKNAVYFLKMKLTGSDEKVDKHLKIMEREVDSSTKIINDLLGFSRTRKPDLSPDSVNEVVKDALSSVEVPKNVLLSQELSTNLPKAVVDRDQLRQVFINVILNAVQAMGEKGGMLKVKTHQEGKFVEVDFSDTGPGIPKENLNKLFDPFFTTKSKGVGLGLAVSHGIIERHSGKIKVTSEVGKGTTFIIDVPVST